VKHRFEDNSETVQAHIISYSQIRDLEEAATASLVAASRMAGGV
jgi:hypothetical protein